MYGTDFESIARVMPGRTRHEIKNKFNAEDKRNSQLINQYLFQPKPIGEPCVYVRHCVLNIAHNYFVQIWTRRGG